MLKSDWYIKKFTPEIVEQIKRYDGEKQDRLQGNSFDEEFETRWVGTAGEIAFKEWLDKVGIAYEWKLNRGIDYWDFTIGRLKIDVKTVSTKYEPKMHYGCDVVKKQWDKIQTIADINGLVFCRHIIPTNTTIVMGWLPTDEFGEKAVFQEAGTKLGKIVISTDQYGVQVKDLRVLEEIPEFS